MRFYFLAIGIVFAPFVVFAAAGGVVINEIGWMGTAASASDEWIELYNTAQSTVDVSGWTLSFFKPATTTPSKVIVLSGSISAGGFYLIERTDENPTDVPADFVSSFGSLVDSGMILELAQNGVVVDRTPEPCENTWCAGLNNPEMSMERIKPDANGADAPNWATNTGVKINGKDAGGNAINGTPKQENSVFNNSSSASASSSSSSPITSSSSVSPSLPIYPALSVNAGPDRIVLVGSSVSFSGFALGINNTPLLDARFVWNFGDGVMQEGRAFEHVYYFPGTYTAALTVSSGPYSGFDTARITAVVPQLSVKNTQAGNDGFVVVANGSDARIDLGSMILRDNAGAQFVIPKNTFVLPKSEVTFSNRVSGLLKSGGAVWLYDAAGRLLREQPRTAINTLTAANSERTAANSGQADANSGQVAANNINFAPKTSSFTGGKAVQVKDEVVVHEDAPALQQETAALSQAPQDSRFAVSKSALFFGASMLIGIFSVAGFFLLKSFF